MTADPMSPKTLAWLANEIEAAMIVNALEEQGIRATAVGGYTSGFRAEAPGGVRVVVAQGDLFRAREVLAEVRREQAEIAGPEADRDEEEPTEDGEERASGLPAGPPAAASPPKRRAFQYSLGTLVALQTIVSVALAMRTGLRADALTAVAIFGTMLGVAILCIVPITSGPTRTRAAWARVGRVLVPGFAAVVLVELILVVVEVLVR